MLVAWRKTQQISKHLEHRCKSFDIISVFLQQFLHNFVQAFNDGTHLDAWRSFFNLGLRSSCYQVNDIVVLCGANVGQYPQGFQSHVIVGCFLLWIGTQDSLNCVENISLSENDTLVFKMRKFLPNQYQQLELFVDVGSCFELIDEVVCFLDLKSHVNEKTYRVGKRTL